METVHKLLRRNRVTCRFTTADGDRVVQARPLPRFLRLQVSDQQPDLSRGGLVGFVECVPTEIPANIRVPALIGRL
jgi:hypothetical protein